MSRLAYGAALTTIWVLAWGSPSPANVLGGMAVAALLLALAPDTWPAGRLRIRPVAIGRFVGYVLVKAVESNWLLTRQILARTPRIQPGVVAVPLPPCSDGLITLFTNVVALTPGTMAIEVARDPDVVYVHMLRLDDLEAARAELHHLAAVSFRAFGSDEEARSFDRWPLPSEEVG